MKNILFIGCGNMGHSILTSLLDSEYNFYIIRKNKNKYDELYNLQKKYNNLFLIKDIDDLKNRKYHFAFINIKPQSFSLLSSKYLDILKSTIIISIMAGISVKTINILFPYNIIFRIMPNINAKIKKSFSAIYFNKNINNKNNYDIDNIKLEIENIAMKFGNFLWVNNEDDMDKMTAICGSGPAFIFHIMELYVNKIIDLSFTKEEAEKMVNDLFINSVKLFESESKIHNINIDDLKKQVTSKNGTTEAGLNNMIKINKDFMYSIERSYQRSREISKEISVEISGEIAKKLNKN